nr:retrovirus-related Pol polyprotein from transposon TNT 1-94 [Tanacetum cinerariifolium]
MAAYAFVAAEEEDTHEPLTYQEAVASEDSVQKPRYKARLVARGFTHKADIDYNELDVKMTFLHGNLKEMIHMRQPPGYKQGKKVCLLNKSFYGLKQSPRSYTPGEYIYLLLYVDDMLIACKSKAEIGSIKSLLKKEFDMKELGEAKKIIDNGKSVKMPLGGHFNLSLKDCLVRPDIAYAVSVVSKCFANPGKNHWEAVKWILKYWCSTANVGLVYGTNHSNHVDVTGCVDSDYAKDSNKGRGILYGPYEGCEGSYLAKGALGRVGQVLEAKTIKVLKVGSEHNAVNALMKVEPGRKLQHHLELLNVGSEMCEGFGYDSSSNDYKVLLGTTFDIGIIDECLCICCPIHFVGSLRRVMKKYNVKESWTLFSPYEDAPQQVSGVDMCAPIFVHSLVSPNVCKKLMGKREATNNNNKLMKGHPSLMLLEFVIAQYVKGEGGCIFLHYSYVTLSYMRKGCLVAY